MLCPHRSPAHDRHTAAARTIFAMSRDERARCACANAPRCAPGRTGPEHPRPHKEIIV